jgi:hypothetical protein
MHNSMADGLMCRGGIRYLSIPGLNHKFRWGATVAVAGLLSILAGARPSAVPAPHGQQLAVITGAHNVHICSIVDEDDSQLVLRKVTAMLVLHNILQPHMLSNCLQRVAWQPCIC